MNEKVEDEMQVFNKKNEFLAETRAQTEMAKDEDLKEYSYLLSVILDDHVTHQP